MLEALAGALDISWLKRGFVSDLERMG